MAHSSTHPKGIPYKPYSQSKKLPRPKRGKHYHTGIHRSLKATKPIAYRSGWEKVVCEYLDWCPSVRAYEYESVAIPYIYDVRSGKIRNYYPDFIVHYSNGKSIVVEVKRDDKIMDSLIKRKTEAGKRWAEERGMQYQIWTNTLIFQLKALNEGRKKTTAKKK